MTENATATERPATLSRELSEFLVEFSIGVHRYVMYPPGHPSLAPVVETVVSRLAELFQDRRALSIGVAQRQLVIDGVATDQKHPVLSDLAQRLHDHQLGALTLEFGVTATELSGLLEALSRETERGGTPLGLLPPEERPHWEHAHLHRVGYERLELRADGSLGVTSEGWADALWLGLARATLGGDPAEDGDGEADAASIARSVRERKGQQAYERAIAEYMRRIPHELRGREGADSERLRRKVADFIHQLDDDTLTRLVRIGDAEERRQFLLDANQSLAVDSVVKVLQAAAEAEEQSISHSMTRMLNKLAVHAEQGRGPLRSQADTALRENVESLIEGWGLKDPNPEAYTTVLDAMSTATPVFRTPEAGGGVPGSERLVEMALEVDAYGPIVARAVDDLVESGNAGRVVAAARRAPEGNHTAARILGALTSLEHFRQILAEGKLDDEVLGALVDEIGPAVVDPLLDVLSDSKDRSVRRRVFDALHRLGPEVGVRAMEHMRDGPWYVQRNMLALLQRLDELPEDFDPRPFLTHDDARVRREALPLALRVGNRDRVIVAALSDPDERILRMGLAELQDGVPDPVLPTLVNRVVRPGSRPAELRAAAVKLLARSRSPLALKTLVELTTAGKTLLGKVKLAPPTLEVLTALRVLALEWSDHDEAREVLEQAARGKDPDIRGAVRITSTTTELGGGPS